MMASAFIASGWAVRDPIVDEIAAEPPALWDRDTALGALWRLAWSALGLFLIAILLGDIPL